MKHALIIALATLGFLSHAIAREPMDPAQITENFIARAVSHNPQVVAAVTNLDDIGFDCSAPIIASAHQSEAGMAFVARITCYLSGDASQTAVLTAEGVMQDAQANVTRLTTSAAH